MEVGSLFRNRNGFDFVQKHPVSHDGDVSVPPSKHPPFDDRKKKGENSITCLPVYHIDCDRSFCLTSNYTAVHVSCRCQNNILLLKHTVIGNLMVI